MWKAEAMADPLCPACRRRFDPAQSEAQCRRCGADLTLLIRLYRSSQRQAASGLQLLGGGQERRAAECFRRAQTIFQCSETALLLRMLHTRAPERIAPPAQLAGKTL